MSESVEMYLKAIYVLKNQENVVRAIDIAKFMNISKPSVSKAISNLKQQQLVNSLDGNIELTTKGTQKAKQIMQRYQDIKMFLQQTLNLEEKDASINACRMEHVITTTCHHEIEKFLKERQHD